MNPLGIFSTVYGPLPAAELAERIRRDGFTCTHLEPRTGALAGPDGEFDVARVRAIRAAFADAGVEISAVGGYTNLVDADQARREAGITKLERLIDVTPEFGTP
ncbi:MAG TPA: hypothetical protein VFK80_06235, partial [Limnochordia bacterium]|nr:hypothetical protein [Limnochordia bacterium]